VTVLAEYERVEGDHRKQALALHRNRPTRSGEANDVVGRSDDRRGQCGVMGVKELKNARIGNASGSAERAWREITEALGDVNRHRVRNVALGDENSIAKGERRVAARHAAAVERFELRAERESGHQSSPLWKGTATDSRRRPRRADQAPGRCRAGGGPAWR